MLCLREACESALKEKHVFDVSEMEGFVDEVATTHLQQLETLGAVFSKAAEADVPTEVSGWLPSDHIYILAFFSPYIALCMYLMD